MRRSLCAEYNVGLTKLYNTMDGGGHKPLADLHRQLDAAVADCYGWESRIAQDAGVLVERLARRNAEVAAGMPYVPFPESRTASRGDQLTVDEVMAGDLEARPSKPPASCE